MRRIRTVIVLVAMVCAGLAGSSGAVSAGRTSVSPADWNGSVLSGKRW